jgi:anti-sigma factor RsiW
MLTWTANWMPREQLNSKATWNPAPNVRWRSPAKKPFEMRLRKRTCMGLRPPRCGKGSSHSCRRSVSVPGPVTTSLDWHWLALAACLLLAVAVGWRALHQLRTSGQPTDVVAAAVDAHLRSLQPGHLTDVPSTDKHTVKPWFDGRLDFAPPVPDLSAEGFPLIGGRLDVLNGKTVAALVYGRRAHILNVFVWKATAPKEHIGSGQRQGYQWLAWRKDGFSFCAVSDTTPEDLQRLMQLFLSN